MLTLHPDHFHDFAVALTGNLINGLVIAAPYSDQRFNRTVQIIENQLRFQILQNADTEGEQTATRHRMDVPMERP